MPRRWLDAFARMLPRLEAERLLNDSTIAMLPHIDYRHRRYRERVLSDLRRIQAGPASSTRQPVIRTGAEFRRWLALGGIDARERNVATSVEPFMRTVDAGVVDDASLDWIDAP